jgi:hypothetical protein
MDVRGLFCFAHNVFMENNYPNETKPRLARLPAGLKSALREDNCDEVSHSVEVPSKCSKCGDLKPYRLLRIQIDEW